MDFSIASILMLDGATNGAIYALLGLATVLVFTVTRVIFIPQGEFVAYGALTMAMLQAGKVPGTVWLLMMLAVLAALMECWSRWHHDRNLMHGIKSGVVMAIPPLLIAWLTLWAAPLKDAHLRPSVQPVRALDVSPLHRAGDVIGLPDRERHDRERGVASRARGELAAV